MFAEVGPGILWRIIDDGNDFNAVCGELAVIPRQLTEVPAAERSEEATQEHHNQTAPSPVVAQRDVISGNGRKREIRSN